MNRNITEFFKIPESVRIPVISGMNYRWLQSLDNKSIRKEKIVDPLNKEKRSKTITVSLTSYPKRINCVYLAIKSLMMQSYKPDRIVLWLADEQFPTRELPHELTNLVQYGLEIKYCEQDLLGHKKYFYAVREQKENEILITVDDDIIFPKNMIKRLMKKHEKHPDCVICERGQVLDKSQLDMPGRWKTISSIGVKDPTYSMNASPGGGMLIPKGAFYSDITDEEKVRALAFRADDVWNMFMCAQNGTKMIKTRKYHRTFSVILDSQVEQLATGNVGGNHYAVVMEQLRKAYPEAWNRILNDKD
ncbi:MAG: glycosyltransferase family 2 protein [Clostridia bacterium]|nr:glycosyltransferase family 2 protein [Clostridia bacterium]